MEKLLTAANAELFKMLIEKSVKIEGDFNHLRIHEEDEDKVSEINLKMGIKIYDFEPLKYKCTLEWEKKQKRKSETDLIVYDPDQPDMFENREEK